MANDLAKLNRLRVNAGKNELKSWKASQAKLDEAIEKLIAEGALDVLPGANLDAQPVTNDPDVAAARPPEPEKPETPEPEKVRPAIAKGLEGDRQTFYGARKSIEDERKKNGPVKTQKTGLARGLDSEPYARNCRERVRDLREKERRDEKANKKSKVELSEEDKRAIKDEAEFRKKGQVDPDKAKRQEKHIAEKRAKREAEGKLKPAKEKNPNMVTAADLARELEMDPKVARAKFRRHKDKIEKLVKGWDGSWEFPIKAADGLKKILRSEK